jgi:hypothetical protein
LDHIAKRKSEFERRQKSGDVGDASELFSISKRDVQQDMKQQIWLRDGKVEALDRALNNLEMKNWIEIDSQDRVHPRADLSQLRW